MQFYLISLTLRNRSWGGGRSFIQIKGKILYPPSPPSQLFRKKTFQLFFSSFLSQLGCDRTDTHTHHARPPVQRKFQKSSLSLTLPSFPPSLSLYTRNCFSFGGFFDLRSKFKKKNKKNTTIHNWYNRYISYRTCCVYVCVCFIIEISIPNKQTKKYGE